MLLWILQLSLCVVTVTASKFSHVIIEQPTCSLNEQLLSELMTMNSQLQSTVTQIQKDVAGLKAGGNVTKDKGALKKQ